MSSPELTPAQRRAETLAKLFDLRMFIGSLFVVFGVIVTVDGLAASRAEIDNLQAQVTEQKQLLARQTREANLLKTDATYLETIARDRLDLMKEGETIVRLETKPVLRGKP